MKRSVAAVLLMSALLLGGCADSDSSDSGAASATPAPNFSNFPDVPMPPQAKMDVNRTALYGQGDGWVGRLSIYQTFVGNGGAASLYDFFKSQMPSYGWREITSVRGPTSIQTWQRGQRIANIQIQSSGCVVGVCSNAAAAITVTPVSGGSAPASSDGGASTYAPPPLPQGSPPPPSVDAQPLQ